MLGIEWWFLWKNRNIFIFMQVDFLVVYFFTLEMRFWISFSIGCSIIGHVSKKTFFYYNFLASTYLLLSFNENIFLKFKFSSQKKKTNSKSRDGLKKSSQKNFNLGKQHKIDPYHLVACINSLWAKYLPEHVTRKATHERGTWDQNS